jgi:hypothetical protein
MGKTGRRESYPPSRSHVRPHCARRSTTVRALCPPG